MRAESWSYYPAMFLTMLLCGLWHGPAWTFIAWGAFTAPSSCWSASPSARRLKRLWRPLQNVYGLVIITCGWVLFRAVDLAHAAAYWRAMFGFGRGHGPGFNPAAYLDDKTLFFLLARPAGRVSRFAGVTSAALKKSRPGPTGFSALAVNRQACC